MNYLKCNKSKSHIYDFITLKNNETKDVHGINFTIHFFLKIKLHLTYAGNSDIIENTQLYNSFNFKFLRTINSCYILLISLLMQNTMKKKQNNFAPKIILKFKIKSILHSRMCIDIKAIVL